MNPGGLGIADLAEAKELRRDERSVLFSARDPKLDRPVEVRLFRPLLKEVDRERFGHEAQLLGRLSAHPNVVTIYNTGFTNDYAPYLVTEAANGDDLATFSQRGGPLPWTAAVDITLQICAGLEQAHRAGVLHRDVRPETVRMVGTTPKLNDFSISVFPRPGLPADGVTADPDPAPELHRAPETFRDVWDERTDLYSAASILYQLIDGHPPMWRPAPDTLEAFQLRLAHQRPPALSEDLAPAALNVFVIAALSKDPIDRPQTAVEFNKELRLIREGRMTGMTPSVLHNTTAVTAAVPSGAAASVAAANGPSPRVAAPQTTDRTVVSALAAPPPQTPANAPAAAGIAAGPAGAGSAAAVGQAASGAVPAISAATTISVGERPEAPTFGSDAPLPASNFAGSHQAAAQDAGGAWAPPSAWQPPHDGTAVFTDLVEQRDPLAPVPPGEMPPLPEVAEPEPVRSPLFLAAVALLVISLLGFLTVISMSVFGSDDNEATAPALPDPDAPTVIQANGDETLVTTTAVESAMEDDAMADESPTTTAGEGAPTTETTVSRLQVPNMVGQNVESATKQLSDLGFDVLIVGRQTANAQPGTVTQQKPDAGNLVTLPLSVTLYIPKASNLPPMVGRSADAVCLELQALGLICNRVNQNHDQIPAGSVIATNPVEGALFSEGSSVALTVSTGPVMDITIPDVAGMPRAEAEAALREAGFTTIAFAMRANNAPKDRVFGSSPEAGQILASNRPITILISTGTAAPVVPELVGRTQAEAEAMLTDLGLQVQVTLVDLPAEDAGIGMVVGIEPAAGTEVAAGSTVTISVGREAMATTTTTIAPDPDTTTETTVAEETTTTTAADSEGSESTEAP